MIWMIFNSTRVELSKEGKETSTGAKHKLEFKNWVFECLVERIEKMED